MHNCGVRKKSPLKLHDNKRADIYKTSSLSMMLIETDQQFAKILNR